MQTCSPRAQTCISVYVIMKFPYKVLCFCTRNFLFLIEPLNKQLSIHPTFPLYQQLLEETVPKQFSPLFTTFICEPSGYINSRGKHTRFCKISGHPSKFCPIVMHMSLTTLPLRKQLRTMTRSPKHSFDHFRKQINEQTDKFVFL